MLILLIFLERYLKDFFYTYMIQVNKLFNVKLFFFMVKFNWILKRSGLKLVLLHHSPFLLPFIFLKGREKGQELTICCTFSAPIDFQCFVKHYIVYIFCFLVTPISVCQQYLFWNLKNYILFYVKDFILFCFLL